ncbi:MAG: type II toxin-antitoxin system RelE/ParE family toxin [Acidobacteriota bacterium]
MIISFKDKETEKIWNRDHSKKFPAEIHRGIRRKLIIIHSSITVEDLKVPPGNKLHKPGGDRIGQFSIRINDQWRICFKWENGNAFEVEVTDYH